MDDEEAARQMIKYRDGIGKLRPETSLFYLESLDHKRVDVGLIIARPPIFLAHNEEEKEFHVWRHKVLKEYLLDPSKYNDQIVDNS